MKNKFVKQQTKIVNSKKISKSSKVGGKVLEKGIMGKNKKPKLIIGKRKSGKLSNYRKGYRKDAKSPLTPIKKLVCPKNKVGCYYITYYVKTTNEKYFSKGRTKIKEMVEKELLKRYGVSPTEVNVDIVNNPLEFMKVGGYGIKGSPINDAGLKNYVEQLVGQLLRQIKPKLMFTIKDEDELKKVLDEVSKQLSTKVSKQSNEGKGKDEYGEYVKQQQNIKLDNKVRITVNRYVYDPQLQSDGTSKRYVRYEIQFRDISGKNPQLQGQVDIVGYFTNTQKGQTFTFAKLGITAKDKQFMKKQIMDFLPYTLINKVVETQGRVELKKEFVDTLNKFFEDVLDTDLSKLGVSPSHLGELFLMNIGFTPNSTKSFANEIKPQLLKILKSKLDDPYAQQIYSILQESKSLDEFLLNYQKYVVEGYETLYKLVGGNTFHKLFGADTYFANYFNQKGGKSNNIIRANIYLLNRNSNPNRYVDAQLNKFLVEKTPDLFLYSREPILEVKLYKTFVDKLYSFMKKNAFVLGDAKLRKQLITYIKNGHDLITAVRMVEHQLMKNDMLGISLTQLREKGLKELDDFMVKIFKESGKSYELLKESIDKLFKESLDAFTKMGLEGLGVPLKTKGIKTKDEHEIKAPTFMEVYSLFLDIFFSRQIDLPKLDDMEENDKNKE